MRRPRRKTVQALLHDVALALPTGFDGVRMVGGFNSTRALEPLTDTPAAMVLDLMGVTTAAELADLLRGVSVTATITALAYTLGQLDTTADDVRGAAAIVADASHPIPPSLLR